MAGSSAYVDRRREPGGGQGSGGGAGRRVRRPAGARRRRARPALRAAAAVEGAAQGREAAREDLRPRRGLVRSARRRAAARHPGDGGWTATAQVVALSDGERTCRTTGCCSPRARRRAARRARGGPRRHPLPAPGRGVRGVARRARRAGLRRSAGRRRRRLDRAGGRRRRTAPRRRGHRGRAAGAAPARRARAARSAPSSRSCTATTASTCGSAPASRASRRSTAAVSASARRTVSSSGDLVVVGVGITPNTRLASDSGLAVDNGVVVDELLRTSDEDVFAAGDVANAVTPAARCKGPLEHWANAQNQGAAAGRSMAGAGEPYAKLPYFYTDQYDLGDGVPRATPAARRRTSPTRSSSGATRRGSGSPSGWAMAGCWPG